MTLIVVYDTNCSMKQITDDKDCRIILIVRLLVPIFLGEMTLDNKMLHFLKQNSKRNIIES